ncbi:MAG: FAD-dependent monooxygenase [Leptolyngbya sp. Prado105]|jgi:2-polyprenyl-6-methoxyphenol hydroxylase-like FAD-dependent oxidoreductase|nr:FAD-dependent monooxygenase [Leptolyngbya sp. Prado105]
MSRFKHAIVIGAGMAGLLAGRVLANHFEQVTIVERDRIPDLPQSRNGMPQSRHLHVLLMRGQLILEALFPGLRDQLLQAGAISLNPSGDVALFGAFGWLPRYQSNLVQLSMSRDLLDWTIRERLKQIPNVQFLSESQVTGLIATEDGQGISGIKIRDQSLFADWIVDASGQTSKTPQWLSALGYEPPEETFVNAFIGYSSRIYRLPKDFQADWKGIFITCSPQGATRGGILFPIEGDSSDPHSVRWLVGVSGAERDYPPTTEAEFLAFTKTLISPEIYEAIREAEPLTPIYGFRKTENRLRQYEKMQRQPENLVVTGHAACTFNPLYGQGMTVAALSAQTLNQCFATHRSSSLQGLARKVQREVAKVQNQPWTFAINQDYRYPSAKGMKSKGFNRLLDAYFDNLGQLMTQKAEIYEAFLEVMHMLKPASSLFQPGIALQVLGQAMRSHAN